MDEELIIPTDGKSSKLTLKERIYKTFILEKLKNKFGYALFLFVSLAIGFVVVKYGMVSGLLIIIGMIAVPLVYGIVAYPRFGIIVFLTMAYFIMWIYNMGVNFPLGTLMDGMEVLFILSLFINQKKKKDWTIFKGPVTTMILIWIGYNIIEVVNPVADSQLAWLFTIRTVAIIMLMYFVFLYYVKTKEFIRLIFKLWIAYASFAALYAFKQEHFGFFPFEENFLRLNPEIAALYFIGGVWRKFSIFSDPVAFAYNMVSASMLCIGLMTGPIAVGKKIILSLLTLFFLTAMLYSGTRGAFVLVPAGLLLLAILKYNKKVLAILTVAGIIFAAFVFVPTGNYTIRRFQSAFRPSNDASFNLRKINQKRIQPYIQSHPLGGGLGSVGTWGRRFAPGSYLSHFEPDSGYVRVAVELGWVGLLLFCFLMFTILRTGINNYYKIRDPELKSYCLAVVLMVFALNIGNYPQEALVQFPTNVYFYLMVALMTITLRIDKQQNELGNASK